MATTSTHYITQADLLSVLRNEVDSKENPPLISLTTETIVKGMVKTSKDEDCAINPFWANKNELTKEVQKTYLPIFDYKARVEKNMAKENLEAHHELGVLSGKKHIGKCLLASLDDTKQYIMVEYFSEVSGTKPIYRYQGEVIEKSAFEKWASNQKSYGSQGQERKVQVLTPNLENIKRLSVNGKVYEILSNETVPTITTKVAQK